ncbi:hypothetical protein SLA2020_282000 [Shorea laevis]
MGLRGILLQQQLLLGAIILAAVAASEPDPSCIRTCGSLDIPYPFGTSEGCYLDPSFLITCNDTSERPTPFLGTAAHSECYNSTNGPGYRCNCSSGYKGNPYLSDGCQDINECEDISNPRCNNGKQCINNIGSFKCVCPPGYEDDAKTDGCRSTSSRSLLNWVLISVQMLVLTLVGISIGLSVLFVGGSLIYWGLKRRNLIKLKEKLFQQNGGLMLQQQLSNYTGSVEPTKIFSTEELKRATNNYDESRILGQGGNGTVYKGVLPGNKVVAIKKSKGFDPSQTKQFINEIAVETAGALAYLHSEASMPIIHRDVKTANILLDDNLTAKVADFGASRQISLDQTKVTTLVQGTFGYLDPEYFHTGQLTEKSDVYSFGVVLAELLTGKKVVFSDETGSDRNLSMSFVSTVKEDRLLQILDNHIINEGNIGELKEVANLVKMCLSVRGQDRPSMKEVAMELEGLRIMKKHPRGKADLYTEETEYLLTEPAHSFSIDVGTSCSSTNTTAGYDSIRNHLLKPLDDDGR